MKEEKEFQTESKELLNLMINSIYSNKDVFLRELISNASDAIDKYKFMAYQSNGKLEQREYEILLTVDKKNRYLEVKDNGIGMNKDQLEKDLGTIAQSGSKEFIEKYKDLKEKKDIDIIGQFGVGFYSAFMVAKKVEVRTVGSEGKGNLFTSDGIDKYTVEDCDLSKDFATSGSSIRVYFKDDTDDIKYSDYLETSKIEELVKRYSDFIRYPIKMLVTESKPVLDKDGKPIEGKTTDVTSMKTLNSMVPLWKKAKSEVTDKDLNDFYKNRFDDYEEPLLSMNIKAEGVISYDALIFIPSHAPYNLYSENYEKGLALFAKGIFIKERCPELVPDYFKFLRGLVDSDDFSLNISREMLQKSPLLTKIASSIETKVIAKLKDLMTSDPEKYRKFFEIYGDFLKFGIYSSYGMKKDDLQDLLVFKSLNSDTPISFKDYKAKMKPDQKYIYYASGKTVESIKMLPEMEKFKKDGTDVLLFADNIDEFTVMMIRDYDKSEFKNISSDSKDDLTKDEKNKLDLLNSGYKRFLDDVKDSLKGKVDEVSFSTRLVDSPVSINTKEGLSLNMEHVINEEEQVKKDSSQKASSIKVLAINPDHPLFKTLSKLTDDKEISAVGQVLYDEAMMLEGYEVEDKKDFVNRLNELMLKAYSQDTKTIDATTAAAKPESK
ncbi:MAG: molecular chaperone HtpG [Bacilli bacterium]